MTDEKLQEALRRMGIDADRVELLLLLPLVQVAWADGKVQAAERALILRQATELGLVDDATRALVEGWLTTKPSSFYLHTGATVAAELLRRRQSAGDRSLEPKDLVARCVAVAEAAGGLFGWRAIDKREHEAISALADELHADENVDWSVHLS